MKKVNELFISFKKKPYKLISLLTILVFVVGISAFSIIKSNQVKGYSGLPYNNADHGTERFHLMGLVDANGSSTLPANLTDQAYIDNIEKHQLVDASSSDLKGISKIDIPYRVTTKQINDNQTYSISGQYGFLPTWTPGKTKVFLYKNGVNSTDAQIELLNDGTKATVDALPSNTNPNSVPTVYNFTAADVENGAFMKFTYMGRYKNEWVDVVVQPVSIENKHNSTLSVGYGKDTSSTEVRLGSYLALSNTASELSSDGTLMVSLSDDYDSEYFYMSDDFAKGPNVNYVDVDYKFYKTIIAPEDGLNEGKDMSKQEQTSVKGYFTFGDFDYNESIGLDATQINQLFVVKPDEGDQDLMDIDQNAMLYGYGNSVSNPDKSSVTPTALQNFKVTNYYKKPATMSNDEATLFYLVQRYGTYNNAYTQLMYTYYDKTANKGSSSYNNDNFIFFNRGYQANTDPEVKGNWLSFTYKETEVLHMSVNASRAFVVNATSKSGGRVVPNKVSSLITDIKALKSGDTFFWNLTPPDADGFELKKSRYKYGFDRDAQDYYIFAKMFSELGFTQQNYGADVTSNNKIDKKYYSFFGYHSGGSDSITPSLTGLTNSNPNGSSVGYISKAMIPVLPLGPIKTAEVVAGSDTMDVNWTVLQNIPIGFNEEKSTTGTLIVEDQVPTYLTVKNGVSGISIKDLGGNDASKYFDLTYDTTTNLIRAEVKNDYITAKLDGFYQNSYTFEYTTTVDPSIYTDQSKLDDFNAKYYKKSGKVENFDGSTTDVVNSYVFLNQAKLITSKVFLDNYHIYSTPEYSESDIDWDSMGTDIPDKYKTPAIVRPNSSITIKKTGEQTDGSQTPLAGAGFNVYTEADDAQKTKTYILDSEGKKALFTTGSDGTVKISDSYEMINSVLTNVGIYNDTYYFEEVSVPSGYESTGTPSSLTITKSGDHTIDIQNNKTRTIGELDVKKEVKYTSDDSDVGAKLVSRGTELYYVVTIQNTSSELSTITDIALEDKLPTDYIDVDFVGSPASMTNVETLNSTTGAFDTTIGTGSYTYDSGTLKINNLNVSLGMQQQIRIKIPVKIKSDAEAGLFWNTAKGSGGGINTDGSTASVSKDSNPISVEVEPFPTGDLKVEKGVSTKNSGTNFNDANGAIVNRGDKLYYTILVSNATSDGSSTKIDNIIVTDEFKFLDKIEIDSDNIKYTDVETSGTIDTSNYVKSLPTDSYKDGKLTLNSSLSLREKEQFRILIPFTVLEDAAPGQFTNISSAIGDAITTAVVSEEVTNTVADYPSGKLELIKEVSDNNTEINNRNNINNKQVDRGDTLYYTVTVKNTSSKASLIDGIVIRDNFDLAKISLNMSNVTISNVEKSSTSPTNPATIDQPLPSDSSFDTNSGLLTISKLSLREGEQVRILIPVSVKEDIPSDVKEITNKVSGSPTGVDGVDSIDSNTVINTLSELDKELFVRQIVVNPNKKVVIPSGGFMSIENVAQAGTIGSGTVSNISVNSGITSEYKKIVIPYSTSNTSYYFNIVIPENYQIAKGYTVELTDANVDYTTGNDINTIFEYSGNGPYYVTVYIEPKVKESGLVPFYNWDYKNNIFGKLK